LFGRGSIAAARKKNPGTAFSLPHGLKDLQLTFETTILNLQGFLH
jgi:hypothetical protein